jgi:hypothetical protein
VGGWVVGHFTHPWPIGLYCVPTRWVGGWVGGYVSHLQIGMHTACARCHPAYIWTLSAPPCSAFADGSAEIAARAAALPPDASVLPLVDFTAGLEGPAWGAMDDVIMGGVSSSSLRWSQEDAAAVFAGEGGRGVAAACRAAVAGEGEGGAQAASGVSSSLRRSLEDAAPVFVGEGRCVWGGGGLAP